MRWFKVSVALLAIFTMARQGVSLLDAVCPPAFGQGEDVRSRDAERERLQKLIESMQKKSPPGGQPATVDVSRQAVPVAAESACTEGAMSEAVEGFTVALPDNLTMIVVDGRKLLIKNPTDLVRQKFRQPRLFLPKGQHFLRFREDPDLGALPEKNPVARDTPYVKDGFFSAWYAGVRGRLAGPDALGKLGPNLWEARWRFKSPLTPHLMGNYYFSQKEFKVAERKYWQAIRENPCFALAHLNLACIYARHAAELGRPGEDFKTRAAEELHWAEEFNVGDVFGVHQAIAGLRDELKIGPPAEAPELRLKDYQPAETMDPKDVRAGGIFDAAMKYLRNDVERARLMNNKAVYFKSKSKNKYPHDLAIDAYNEALRVLGDEAVKEAAAHEVANQICENAARLCKSQWQGGNEEYDVYKEFMEKLWRDGRR